jgi:class 3 adenylate cyclase
VAAPLLSPAGEVIGALYGDVWQHLPASTYGEDEFRRLLVRMLASAVSAGLARQEAERERTLLRQFFSPALADQLSQNRSLIEEARSAEVTVLFCDVRDFSGTSEKLEPAQMFAWISRVLEELSRCVLAQQGVLVDYLGDELMAMWGAPEEQPDHARRAVQAALAMLAAVEELNRQEGLPPTRVGIGLHSGPAQVGNTGSSSRFKYGPLGDTVNIANRIQGMTKYLKCPLLASVETWQQAQRAGGKSAIARRVVTARLAGVQQERDLYELANPASGNGDFFRASQEALQALDEEASKPLKQRNFANVIEQAGGLLKTHRGDGPLQLILARATQAELTGEFARVWTPPGK